MTRPRTIKTPRFDYAWMKFARSLQMHAVTVVIHDTDADYAIGCLRIRADALCGKTGDFARPFGKTVNSFCDKCKVAMSGRGK